MRLSGRALVIALCLVTLAACSSASKPNWTYAPAPAASAVAAAVAGDVAPSGPSPGRLARS